MPFDFPSAPTNGQQVTGPNGALYQWDGVKWVTVTAATIANVSAGNVGRNVLHNSMMAVQQRGQGPWTGDVYTVDRWFTQHNTDTISFSVVALVDADRAAIGDEAARYALQNVFTGSATTTAYNSIGQNIEGVRRTSGKTVILSFWAKAASGAPKLGICTVQVFGTGGSPSAALRSAGGSVTISTTWTRYSVSFAFPSASGKTLGTNGDDYGRVEIYYSSAATVGAISGIGVQSGTIQLWGIQLEVAQPGQTQPTPLEKVDPRMDLANCQRFYQIGSGTYGGWANTAGAGLMYFTNPFQTAMRAAPTMVLTPTAGSGYSAVVLNSAGAGAFSFAPTATGAGAVAFNLAFTASADL